MKDISTVVLRNSEAEQYICAARKSFKLANALSESTSKMLICHFSDIHGDIDRFNNVMELIEYYKPDFAVHTGDIVTWNSSESTEYFFDKIRKSDVPIYNTIGNHETFGKGGVHVGGSFTNEYLHKRFIVPLKNIKTNAEKGWYHVDFDAHKIRLVVLNPYEYFDENSGKRDKRAFLQEQCDWFVSVLSEASEMEYAVIVASHEIAENVPAGANDFGFCQRFTPYPWGGPSERPHNYIIEDIVDAFQNGKSLKSHYVCDLSGQEINIDCVPRKKVEFICYMLGHTHADYVGYLPTHPSQLSVTMTCSGCFPAEYHNIGDEVSDLPRIPGTVSEDAVNFYVIDREKKTLSIVRVGASVNDLMETRRVLVIPYEKKGE